MGGQLSQLFALPVSSLLAGKAKQRLGEKQRRAWCCASGSSAAANAPLCHQHRFSHRSQTQHHTGCCEENCLHPRQAQHTWDVRLGYKCCNGIEVQHFDSICPCVLSLLHGLVAVYITVAQPSPALAAGIALALSLHLSLAQDA